MSSIDVKNLTVKEIMSTDLITVSKRDTMSEVKSLMKQHRIHHVLVTDSEGNLQGVVSDSDVMQLEDWGVRYDIEQSRIFTEQVMKSQSAGDRMTSKVVHVKPDDTLAQCADILKSNRFHALPVVDNGVAVGIVTTYDLINTAYCS